MNEPITPSVPENLLPYLNEIAERLYSGHATIMIGSGFSKNAEPHDSSSPSFPDWAELGDMFYEKLHGQKPGADTRYGNVATLAHEVEAAIGRTSLNSLISDKIPNDDYEPSELHKKLLGLPWTDIFTTNYDTLIERTCRFLTSQRYDIVLSQDSLIYARKPRIIKLHGCVSSNGPYTVTDEDYRRYPKDHAPFVNTVRQALLENTLCLIGFSGDDHNFREWVGWLHDNLGLKNSPKMYLIGSLYLSGSQKKLLESRNIVSVDMSEYPDIQSDDHKKGLHRFIDYLKSKDSKYRTLDWPSAKMTNQDLSELPVDMSEYPDIQSDDHKKGLHRFIGYLKNKDSKYRTLDWPSAKMTDQDLIGFSAGSIDMDVVRKQTLKWRDQRRSYPGWVVAPPDSRRRLWDSTKAWTENYPSTDKFPKYLDLQFAFELIWRMEKYLCPILDDQQIKFIETIIDRYLADDDEDEPSNHPHINSFGATSQAALSQTEINNMCHYLVLATMRYYREKGLLEQWCHARKRLLDRACIMSSEHRARFHYEQALSALFKLDLPQLKRRLEEWPIDDSLPFWEAKRASILSEFGSLSDAAVILEKSLSTIRSRSNLKPIVDDYSLVSQESIVIVLQRAIDMAIRFPESPNVNSELIERSQLLSQYKCDPWKDLEGFKIILDRSPQYTPYILRDWSFDIGQITSKNSLTLTNYDEESLIAYRFLLYCEETGIPFRIGNCIIATESATGTLSRIGTYSPYYAFATLVRIGDKKIVDHIFNRPSIARFATHDVDRLIGQYMKSLELANVEITSGSLWTTNIGIRMSAVVPEIISRLCCRCSYDIKKKIVKFIRGIFISDDRSKYQGIDRLNHRMIESLSRTELLELLPDFLRFPILEELDHKSYREYINPVYYVNETRFSDRTMAEIKIPSEYLDGVRSDNIQRKRWCVLTLGQFYLIGALDKRTTDEFADALWSNLDEYGLPTGIDGYHRFVVVMLPAPSQYEPIMLFKKWIEGQQILVQVNNTFTRRDPDRFCNEIIGASKHVKWSDDETISIVRKLVSWWNHDKRDLNSNEQDISRYERLFQVLVKTLVVVMESSESTAENEDTRSILERLSREFDEYNVSALRFRHACLHIFPEWRSGILRRVEEGMVCSSSAIARDSFLTMEDMSRRIGAESPEAERVDLIRIVSTASEAVRWRSEAALEAVLGTMTQIVMAHPWLFDDDAAIESSLLEGLRYLIEETAIHAQRERFDNVSEDRWNVGKRLIVRREAVGLAYALFQRCQKLGNEPPEVLRRWESLCQSDKEFAEIRNKWKSETNGW